VSYYLEVPLDGGQSVLAEVTSQIDGELPAGSATDVVGKLPEAFGAGLDRAQALAGEVLGRMRGLTEPPDVVSVEFGLSLSAKTGVVIAESSATAHIKIAVEWHRTRPEPE
jgi:Trypsin-co-occurring domain 1